MRVLLIGPEWDTGLWAEYCGAGLEAGGHEVAALLYGRDLARPVGLWGRVRRRLAGPHRFHIGRVLEAMRRDNLRVLDAAVRHRPDLTVVLKGEVLLPETVERLRDLTSGPVVQWCGDNPSWFPHIMAAAHLYDRFFLAEPSYATDLARLGVGAEFMTHAADPDTWGPAPDEAQDPPEWDVVFVGDARHNMGHLPSTRLRVDLVEVAARSGLRVAVWGRGWEKLDADSPARQRHEGLTLLPAAAVARTYRRAKIALNAHHAQMREGVNMRTFEISAAGAFQLCDAKARLGELLEIGDEVAVYEGVDDLADLLHRYAADDAARARIAEAGRRRVLRDHTYTARMAQLVARSHGEPAA
ncbi:MAG: glycosyltransferase [Chloroflexi bacterium]|nr:glycosyltransferase [Chloroflexota bacterium]